MRTKWKLLLWLMLIMGSTNAWATHYDIGPGEYFGTKSLFNDDTLHMTGGYGSLLTLADTSVATIENTDPSKGVAKIHIADGTLNLSGGNVGDIDAEYTSTINITGGNVDYLKLQDASISYLRGGQIGTLASDLIAFPDPPYGPPGLNGWIQFFCREYDYDDDTLILTGIWEDYSDFSMQMLNLGTIPTYDQIEFHIVPEPGILVLLGMGGFWLKRRVSSR
jgi:hypothetical protein